MNGATPLEIESRLILRLWCESNPCANVGRHPESPGRDRVLSDDERERLLNACKQNKYKGLYPIVVIALSTGCRQGEILGLRWSDVDLKQKCIRLQETKNGQPRKLPLYGKAFEVLADHAKVRRLDSDFVFPATYKNAPKNVKEPWDEARAAAKLTDFKFHDLRHSAASYLAMSGATSLRIAAILGHKTLEMVKRYAHISDDHSAQVIASMNEKFLRDAHVERSRRVSTCHSGRH